MPEPGHRAHGAAPGKVILFGEHAVVYGHRAIAAPLGSGLGTTVQHSDQGPLLSIPRWGQSGLTVEPTAEVQGPNAMGLAFATALRTLELDPTTPVFVTIDGRLPMGVGLGSSAAFAVSLIRGLAAFADITLSEADLLNCAEAIEKVFHGTPSGLDHTVVATSQCLLYRRSDGPTFQKISVRCEIPVVISWAPRVGTTREIVGGVRRRHDANPREFSALFEAMDTLVDGAISALETGDLPRLGQLFDLNHGYLSACGVSGPSNEDMVHLARASGALGAKLTGAGRGGAVIALAPNEPEQIVARLVEHGYGAFHTTIQT
ncbi:MAG: mevalonate kinase [Myxococcota bacterium]|nr:mevalonate kinase [Myxococcota bacterium]